MKENIDYRVSPALTNPQLNELFASAWPNYKPHDFSAILSRSLAFVGAYVVDNDKEERLIGFVNVAWDGGVHAFLLDTTVHPEFRLRGIGQELVNRAARVAEERGATWLHVDYESHLHSFYARCGFSPTMAGLRGLNHGDEASLC